MYSDNNNEVQRDMMQVIDNIFKNNKANDIKKEGSGMTNNNNNNNNIKRIVLYCLGCNTVKNYFDQELIEQVDEGVHIVFKNYEVLFHGVKLIEHDDYYFLGISECIYCDSVKA